MSERAYCPVCSCCLDFETTVEGLVVEFCPRCGDTRLVTSRESGYFEPERFAVVVEQPVRRKRAKR